MISLVAPILLSLLFLGLVGKLVRGQSRRVLWVRATALIADARLGAGLLTLRRTQLSASGSRDDHETIAKLIQLHQQKTFWRCTSNSSESVNIEPGSRCSHN